MRDEHREGACGLGDSRLWRASGQSLRNSRSQCLVGRRHRVGAFGDEKGAFTGAEEQHAEYLEEAHGGVLFLDEIGEMPSDVQVKLLRFLEEHTFERLGSTETIEVDVQIVTATNANLDKQIDAGDFREDLYYRLKVHEMSCRPSANEGTTSPCWSITSSSSFGSRGRRWEASTRTPWTSCEPKTGRATSVS